MAFVVEIGVGEAGGAEEAGFGLGLAGTGAEDGGDLLTDWRTDLLTDVLPGYLKQGGENGGEEELDECGGIPGSIAGGEDLVVFLLAVADDAFHRKPGEERVPAAEDECLPKSADATISIRKGVDGADAILPPQRWDLASPRKCVQTAHFPRDLGDLREHRGGEGEGWLVGHWEVNAEILRS